MLLLTLAFLPVAAAQDPCALDIDSFQAGPCGSQQMIQQGEAAATTFERHRGTAVLLFERLDNTSEEPLYVTIMFLNGTHENVTVQGAAYSRAAGENLSNEYWRAVGAYFIPAIDYADYVIVYGEDTLRDRYWPLATAICDLSGGCTCVGFTGLCVPPRW